MRAFVSHKRRDFFFFLKNFFLSFFARNSPKTDENGQTAFHWRKKQSVPLSFHAHNFYSTYY